LHCSEKVSEELAPEWSRRLQDPEHGGRLGFALALQELVLPGDDFYESVQAEIFLGQKCIAGKN
jgi:hypothetical protein